jgi:hypothetical protein
VLQQQRFGVRFSALLTEGLRGDPEHESKHWLKKLAEFDSKRNGYLELAAEGFMRREELRRKLAALEETRETAGRELQALKGRSELLRNLQREKVTIMERYAGMVPEALETLSPQERHRVYRMLRLKVVAQPDDMMEVQGVIGDRFLGTKCVLRRSSPRPSRSRMADGRAGTARTLPSGPRGPTECTADDQEPTTPTTMSPQLRGGS